MIVKLKASCDDVVMVALVLVKYNNPASIELWVEHVAQGLHVQCGVSEELAEASKTRVRV